MKAKNICNTMHQRFYKVWNREGWRWIETKRKQKCIYMCKNMGYILFNLVA